MFYIFMIIMLFIMEYYIKRHMDEVRTLHEQRPIANGKIVLKKYYNSGAACNFLKNRPKTVRHLHLSAMFAVFAALFYEIPKKHAFAAKAGLSFLAGGGLSNLRDRLTKGYVVDYFSFGFGPKRFQKIVFNIADICIFTGIILFTIQSFQKEGDLSSWVHKR